MYRDKQNLFSETEPLRCPCGAIARIRYKIPVTWVECKRKCGRHTCYYPDIEEQHDPVAVQKAVAEWNRMVEKNG